MIFTNIIPDTMSQTTDILGQLAPVVTFLVGLLLAFLIIQVMLGLFGIRTGKRKHEDEPDDWPYEDENELPTIDW